MACAQLGQCGGTGFDLLVFLSRIAELCIRIRPCQLVGSHKYPGSEVDRAELSKIGRSRRRVDGGQRITARWRAD